MSNGNGHRWSKFWWQDYLNDQELKLCSLAAQGLWMRMLCVMHDTNGYLLVAGRVPNGREIAKLLSVSERQIGRLLEELTQRGVARRDNNDVIYCQRMVNDIKASEAGREAVGRRWNGPNPNREPTSEPNGDTDRGATPDPFTRSLEAEAEEEPPRSPPVGGAARRGNSRPDKPLYRNGFLQIIADEGMPSLEPPDEALGDQVANFLAIKGLRYGHA